MALTADRLVEVSGLTEKIRVRLTASDIYYKGAILQIDAATGFAKVAGADVAGEYGIGVMVKHTEVGAGVNPEAEVEVGKIWIPFAAAAQADVGDWVYATADDTIAKAAPVNGGPAGIIVDVRVGVSALVDFRRGGPKTLAA